MFNLAVIGQILTTVRDQALSHLEKKVEEKKTGKFFAEW